VLLSQHGQEELDAFTRRVNDELARLGPSVRNVSMSTCLHEKQLGGRINIPSVLVVVMITCEDSP
jgi:hypothetical protein